MVFHDAYGRTLVAAGHKDNHFYAYDLAHLDQGPVWSRPYGPAIGMLPAYDPLAGVGGTFLFVDGNGTLYGVDSATGKDRWTPLLIGDAHGNMALTNGLLFANVSKVGLLVIDTRTGQKVGLLVPDHVGSALSGPAIAQGFVYWQSGGYLNAWSLPAATTPIPLPAAPGP